MALSRVKVWQAGDVLTASDLNAEINNLINNGQTLVQPWVGTFDLDGNTLVLDGDADTSIDCATDDTIDITIAGADDFRLTANTFTALSGSSITVASGNIGITAGNLTVTDGQTSLADAGSHTNTVATPLIIEATTSGTPAANIGTGILHKSQSADENPSNVGQANFVFSDVTAGSEDSFFQVMLRTAGAALGIAYEFYRTTAFAALFTHANTANRVYTLQDSSDTLVGRATVDTLTNKTVTAGILSGCFVTGAAPASPTANVIYTDSLVKGFVAFQVNGTIDTDLNVSSITDNGAGDWTVNWATSFSSANYCLNVSAQADGVIGASDATAGFNVDSSNNPTASAARVVYSSNNGGNRTASDPTGTRVRLYVSAMGLQ